MKIKTTLSMSESIAIEDKASEIFNEVYSKHERKIIAEFRSRAKKELKVLLPMGSSIRISKNQKFEVKGCLKTQSLHKDTYIHSVYTMLVPHTTYLV